MQLSREPHPELGVGGKTASPGLKVSPQSRGVRLGHQSEEVTMICWIQLAAF